MWVHLQLDQGCWECFNVSSLQNQSNKAVSLVRLIAWRYYHIIPRDSVLANRKALTQSVTNRGARPESARPDIRMIISSKPSPCSTRMGQRASSLDVLVCSFRGIEIAAIVSGHRTTVGSQSMGQYLAGRIPRLNGQLRALLARSAMAIMQSFRRSPSAETTDRRHTQEIGELRRWIMWKL